jgi:hydroxymethylpyrimidine pyrophosphatase-like HAD family hydrolase
MAALSDPTRPRAERAGQPPPFPGLVMDFQTIADRLRDELRRGPTLDAFLLAAGLAQIADDHLHEPTYPLGSAARYLSGHDAPALRLAGAAAAAIDGAASAGRSRRASTRAMARWRSGLGTLLDALALAQVAGSGAAGVLASPPGWTPAVDRLPLALREAVIRVPTCFAHFDQRPADIVSLAAGFADRWPDRARPLLVAGVRTSGGYLGPLCAARLRALGYRRVYTVTVRPGHRLAAPERARVRDVASDHGLALLVDDPPVTGGSVRDAAATLTRAGVAADSIVLVLAMFGSGELPPALAPFASVRLAGDEWAVEADLSPVAVTRALQAMEGRDVLSVEPVAPPYPQPARGHRRALYRVAYDDAREPAERTVLVEGVGLGYLGAHRLASPALVQRFSPPVLGMRDGLLYREWLPDDQRIRPTAPGDEHALAVALAEYVAQRRETLACPSDLSLRMAGEQPAWLIASQILAAGFGRGWPAARLLVTDRAVRRLLRVSSPSVVDGNTDLAQWFGRGAAPASLRKADVGEDRFSNLTAQCFDAVYDLAGVAARADSPTLAGALRRALTELTGEEVGEERWLLYELVHLWGRERTQPGEAHDLGRARARAMQRYFAGVFLSDVTAADDGPLCALDIDGVLESHALGFPAMMPAAALALRTLLAHGYRPVPATGRSLDEVAERCRAYGLPGAVAEYGSVTFRACDGRVRSLVSEPEAAALDRLREALAALDGVVVDPDYRHCVRAFTIRGGARAPVPECQLASALATAGAERSVRVIGGEAQTDFVAGAVDKGVGLRALARELGCEAMRPYALAIGDTASDLPFAEVAARACAPGHADPVLRRAGFEIMSRPYQAGLAQAVGRVVGHRPGGCPLCRPPADTPERAIACALLGVAERGRLGIVGRALELRWRAR